ncbi:two component, sigma54 specific, transcriptional regulator, Fis family [Desulfonatronospira thiodismutans ASO3-1]|uniref:Two component, sigma54 specific, transcriptional regulator, Fis family n=1 Tax=Desulfonatronospira thiodismutans ASO3-1 TaxID=555779 RepID=D6SRI8_9BACT|nr:MULTISPECIES: sigma-54 dependent transcriptional regulator [Desulfonatronospira]EFI33304.1 two component, sigma54 specific, transcriptional regulator, Fis family [Desulfonatronospira thiodismutans ASO3-1]RQD73500.1 MAG: sigma-54-dependent Fis family transcriptional regulator [Desulfonatronospira sp. MSAO_Bac3]
MNSHILVIDDEKNYLLILETILEEEGYTVTALNDPQMALDYLDESEVDVVITDMKMPGISGQDILEHIQKHHAQIPVLIMTAYGSIDGAVEAMRCGAFDYISKPFSNDELMLSVRKAALLSKSEQEKRLMTQTLAEQYGPHKLVGNSRSIREVLQMVSKVAPSRSTVLITGESGTGKELIARAIHYSSPRREGPFISINCMSLSPGVLESELFGHEKGSFTGATAMKKGRFELADGGTLFLDEVGELSQDLQVKLLRVLQEKAFERVGGSRTIHADIRLVAATNKDLKQAVEKGEFREDLYYRLNVVGINLPPLRERREDIPVLVAHFMQKFSSENQQELKKFAPEALEYLTAYEWPGNVRQLENVVERCMVLASREEIGVEDLPSEIKDEEAQFKSAVDLLPVELELSGTLEKIEAALIRRALVKSGFVQVKAAELLNISKSLLQYKLKKYNIQPK